MNHFVVVVVVVVVLVVAVVVLDFRRLLSVVSSVQEGIDFCFKSNSSKTQWENPSLSFHINYFASLISGWLSLSSVFCCGSSSVSFQM